MRLRLGLGLPNPNPNLTQCMLGDAHAARRLLLQTPSPPAPGAPPSGGEAEG